MLLNLSTLINSTSIYEAKTCGDRGQGLVANESFDEGECIVCEEVMVAVGTLETTGGSIASYNKYLAQQVKAVANPSFSRRFFELPHLPKEKWGPFAAVFERGSIPIQIGAVRGRVLGLSSAYLNHACLPNAQHTLFTMKCNDDREERYFLTVYACKKVAQGEEITIPYDVLYMDRASRQQFLLQEYGFECACKLCGKENSRIEAGFELIYLKLPIIFTEKVIDAEPAGILQMAHTLLDIHLKAEITDNRFARIWEHCAFVCTWHSDEGRAMVFLSKAQNAFLKIQGANGKDFLRIKELQKDPMKTSHSGSTQRGLSSKNDMDIIRRNQERDVEILFMLDANDLGDYIKLSEYERAHTSTMEAGDEGDNCEKSSIVDIDELVRELQVEKKEHDQSRHRHASGGAEAKSKKAKRKGSEKYKKKARDNVGGGDVDGDKNQEKGKQS
ncbi:hypothetical protein PABG_04694 [Paracoccidioides brasiliensis Pb03]|nr:hypothetical protein PABG_04694 [Paracoccidioides brasiliensis Pb03]